MNTDMDTRMNTDKNTTDKHGSRLLYEGLSYQVRGAIYDVSNKYGKGLKEQIYQKALAEEFHRRGLSFEEQKRITITSTESGKLLGVYIPDFIVDDKIIIEIKASEFTSKQNIEQQLSYLKASKYEIGFLVNFSSPTLYIKRSIYTNDRKHPSVLISNLCLSVVFLSVLISAFAPSTARASILLKSPPNNMGLVGLWNFNAGAGTSVADSSGSGNTGIA